MVLDGYERCFVGLCLAVARTVLDFDTLANLRYNVIVPQACAS